MTEDDPSGDNFDLKPLDRVDCTYTNTLQTGAIKITKRRKHAADGPGDHPSRV